MQHIKRRVLDEGALQPVIGLLSSTCTESQREAALLLGQFATTDPDYKTKIVQRGAVPPLIEMLGHHDPQLKEMAAFALGRLAQNSENQAGIVQVHYDILLLLLPHVPTSAVCSVKAHVQFCPTPRQHLGWQTCLQPESCKHAALEALAAYLNGPCGAVWRP